jgi:hypothetical protein
MLSLLAKTEDFVVAAAVVVVVVVGDATMSN